jgi:hypothetical protein
LTGKKTNMADDTNPPELWEILVPTTRRVLAGNAGRWSKLERDHQGCVAVPCTTRYHRVWDAKVRAISGGLTVLKPAKGYWMDPVSKTVFHDRTIPVRIACTRTQLDEVIKITLSYYNQLAVMAYKLSSEVLIVRA